MERRVEPPVEIFTQLNPHFQRSLRNPERHVCHFHLYARLTQRTKNTNLLSIIAATPLLHKYNPPLTSKLLSLLSRSRSLGVGGSKEKESRVR